MAGGPEEAAGAEELAACGIPMVEEQQQDEDGHNEDGGGHGCQKGKEDEPVPSGSVDLSAVPRLHRLGASAKSSLEEPQRSQFSRCPSRGHQKPCCARYLPTRPETSQRGSVPSRTTAAGISPRGDRPPAP